MKRRHNLMVVTACVLGGAFALIGAPAFGITTYDITTTGLTDAEHTRSTDNYRNSHAQYLNEAGQAVGYAERYNGITYTGRSAWLYNGTTTLNIGLTDAGHTNSSTGYQLNNTSRLNEAGQALGSASRFNGTTSVGQSAWLYNGMTTLNIGLTDSGHTNSNTGYQSNSAEFLNEAGQSLGHASRFNGDTNIGRSTWLYNGTTTLNIGLTDASHTDSSTGYQDNYHTDLNEAGQALGTASRYNGATYAGDSVWLYDGATTVNIGLTDAGHTNSNTGYQRNNAYFLNEAGQVVGIAERYNGSTSTGLSAWLYNGTTTQEIGLMDAGHTNSSTGYQHNYANRLNEAGQALGFAERFNGTTSVGQSAWLYNGTTTQEIGLKDAGHTNSSTGYQHNYANRLNEAGQAAGYANRFNGTTSVGQSAWLYNGTTTQEIGLTDAGHTNSSTGYQYNQADHLNEAGQVAGFAERYNGIASTGRSAWLYNGTTTLNIGLTDAGHTNSSTGYQYNEADLLNEAGQVTGFAERYNGATYTGQSAWFYDATIDQTYSMDLSINPTDGYASSNFLYLGDDGLGLGYYSLFDTGGNDLGIRAFSFTVEDGVLDLGSLVADLSGEGWLYLADAIRANGAGQIIGSGLLDDMTSGSVAYLLTPQAVPVPPAVWLFGSGLVGLVSFARQKRAT